MEPVFEELPDPLPACPTCGTPGGRRLDYSELRLAAHDTRTIAGSLVVSVLLYSLVVCLIHFTPLPSLFTLLGV